MAWLGLDHDEGPYRQTERQDLYNRKIQTLLDNGQAYRCYCSAERVEELRKQLQAEGKTLCTMGFAATVKINPMNPTSSA